MQRYWLFALSHRRQIEKPSKGGLWAYFEYRTKNNQKG